MDSNERFRVRSRSPEATKAFGRALGRLLRGGEICLLEGELGAGKTVLARGLAEGLGVIAPEEVRSPSYLVLCEHEGPKPFLHLDAYFAGRAEGLMDEALAACLEEGAVLAIEWASRLDDLARPSGSLRVELAHLSPETREIRCEGTRELWGERFRRLEEAAARGDF